MKRKRMAVDAAMTVLLPCLMAYSLIGETFHELAGVAMLALFITHHILNRGWYKGLFRGRTSPFRAFQTAVDLLLCIVMVCLPLSGILMSKRLFPFLPTADLAAWCRTIHLPAACWGFLLMSLHLGLHLDRMIKKRPLWLKGAAAAAAVYGLIAFFRRGLPDYLFLRSRFAFFDPAQSRLWFFADYLAIMVLFALVGYETGRALKTKGRQAS